MQVKLCILLTNIVSGTLPWTLFPAAHCLWPADLSRPVSLKLTCVQLSQMHNQTQLHIYAC